MVICMWTAPHGDAFSNDHPLAHSMPGAGAVHPISFPLPVTAWVRAWGEVRDMRLVTSKKKGSERLLLTT